MEVAGSGGGRALGRNQKRITNTSIGREAMEEKEVEKKEKRAKEREGKGKLKLEEDEEKRQNDRWKGNDQVTSGLTKHL